MVTTGADILVGCLHDHGVTDVFGMPGSHSTAIYDAIVRDGRIRTWLCRNEQAGAFMADGYARVTGRPGVVCTTAGPGATNALTGVAEAWGDSMPLLLIAGQVNHDRLDVECGNYHEADLEGIFRPCTRVSRTLRKLPDLPGLVAEAFAAMETGRRRPAALFLPQDLMSAAAEGGDCLPGNSQGGTHEYLSRGDAASIEAAARLLANAKRPILLAGGGAVWADAAAELCRLAERLRCPVVTTLNGKGILDERDPLSLGHARSVRAHVAMLHADVMLAAGCRFTEVFTYFRKLQVPQTLIHIDIDPSQINVNYHATVAIVADAKQALHAIREMLPERVQSDWRDLWDKARAARHPKPEWLINVLREEMPENGVVFTDASEMALRMHTDYPAYAPRTFFYPSTFIALGWGYPAAIGAAVALPDRPVACVSGDGGFVMTAQELATAVRYQLRLIAIVHNDSAYGAMKNLQKRRHEGRYHDSDLNNPDFVKLAEAYGLPGTRAADSVSFRAALRQAIQRPGPSLIEVPDQWRYLRGF
jgi:acetolactate synthase-1/2/3 large subunit